MTKNKSNNATSDSELFRQAVSDARPLKKTNVVTDAPNKKPIRVNRNAESKDNFAYNLSDFAGNNDNISAEESLAYRGEGIQQRLFKKLKNGQFDIEAHLDMHGLTVDTARQVLNDFLFDCLSRDYRCVIIVHGKGSRGDAPKLKPMLNHWLKQIPDVLAFCSTQPRHGGTGAVYVLLKNVDKTKHLE